MKYPLLALLVMVLLSACGKATIDASSQDALQRSVEKIAAELNQSQKDEFQQAVITIAMHHSTLAVEEALSGNAIDAAGIEQRLLDTLHGKSAEQVVAYAKTLKGQGSP